MKKKMLIWPAVLMAAAAVALPISAKAGEKADDFWKFYEQYPHMQEFYPFGVYGGVSRDDFKSMDAMADLCLELMNDYSLNVLWGGGALYANKRWKEGFEVPELTPHGKWLLDQAMPRYEIKCLPTLIEWTYHTREVFAKYQRQEPLLNETEIAEVETILNTPIQGAGDSKGKQFQAPLKLAADLAKTYTNSIVGFITDDEPASMAPVIAAIDLVEKYTGLLALSCFNNLSEAVKGAMHRRLAGGDWYTDSWTIGKYMRELNRQCPDNVFWFIPLATAYSAHEPTKPDLRDPRPYREELRLQFWQAVALGCKGFFYYNFGGSLQWAGGEDGLVDALQTPDCSNNLMTELGELAPYITTIGPLLLSCRAETGTVAGVECGKVRFPEFEGPALDYGLLKDTKHDRYFLVPWNNDIYKEQSGSLTLPRQLVEGRNVYDLMDLSGQELAEGGKLNLKLPPGGGRIYLVGSKSEYSACRDTIQRYQAKHERLRAKLKAELALVNGIDLKAVEELRAKALKAERKGKWAKALDLFIQTQKETEEAESKSPGFVAARLKLKNIATALSRTEDLLRTHKRVLEINSPSPHPNNWKQYLFTNKYVGKEMEDWLTLLVNQYFAAQGKFRSGKGGPEFLKEVTDLDARATQNVRAVETAIDKRLKEIRKPIKVAYVTANRDEKEYITTYSWAMENCYITWFAPDGKGSLSDIQGKQLDPSAYNDVWIHQLRYNEPPARGRLPTLTQALIPELMKPETIKAMREYTDKGGGMLLTGIAGLYTLPLGIETNAPDRLRENRLYISARFGLGLTPVAGCEKHPLFDGFPAGGFYTSGNADLNNVVAECAWDERKPGGIVLANELDETTGRQGNYAAIVEYHSGSGKVLVLGGKSCDYTPDNCPGAVEYRPYKVNKDKYWASLRDQYRRFTLNALLYLASKDSFRPEVSEAGESSHSDLPALISASVPKVGECGGDPAKVDWSRALALGNWHVVTGAKTDQDIKSYLAHDGQYLYIRLDHALSGTKLKSSEEIWGGDVWELFFSTSRYEPPYRQIAVNVPGKYVCFRYGEEDKDWDSGAKVVSSSDSGHWQISLALPLDKLLPDGIKTGDAFYANFYRQVTSTGELLAWSPNFTGSFHELKRMGRFTLGS